MEIVGHLYIGLQLFDAHVHGGTGSVKCSERLTYCLEKTLYINLNTSIPKMYK